MTVRQLRYSKLFFARRGNEIYETQIRPKVEKGNRGKIVAIDIETGAFEVAEDTITASLETARMTPRPTNMAGYNWASNCSPFWNRSAVT